MIRLLPLLIILAMACQCSQLPTPEPTATGTAVPTLVATLPPSATPTRHISPTASATAVPAQSATPLPTETATAVPATVVATVTASATELPETYTVGRDEWLILIAQRLYQSQYGWEWECLWRLNRAVIGDNPHLIYRGQKLRGIRECGGWGTVNQ